MVRRGQPAVNKQLVERTLSSLLIFGMATAAFAMGRRGIHFVEHSKGFEAYAINASGIATMTSGLPRYLA